MKCPYFKREKGEVKKNLCMAEMATLGVAGDTYMPSEDEVIDFCLSDDGFKECHRFKWVEREKDKERLKHVF
ncbi:MAG: hypothetical protein QXN63_02790 [Candidatus Bathyarchaeia archaeon]